MRVRLVIAAVAILIGILVAVFTVSGDEVGTYNNASVAVLKDMDSIFEPYVEEMNRYVKGERARVDFLRREHSRIADRVGQAKQEIDALSVPDCDYCRAFHAALVAYVDNARAFSEAYAGVNDYIEVHNPPQEGDSEHVAVSLLELGAEEQKLIKEVIAKQKAMVDEYGLTLK